MSSSGEPIAFTARRLDWQDEGLGAVALPGRKMEFRSGLGSGLTRRVGDPPGIVWAIGDRGPNLKPKTLVELYGVAGMKVLSRKSGAKVMPRPDLGPQVAKLRVGADRVELVASHRLRDSQGALASGLPIPGGEHARREPAFDLDGRELAPDPAGFDTEGIAAAADGSFWIGDEFGPSLVRIDAEGRILARIVPEGVELAGAAYPVRAGLPAIAARRHLNRGFEALASSGDGRWLFLAFQSPLAHPDVAAHQAARHVRIWRLDAATLAVAAQYLYPLDPPEAFRRDLARGPVERGDIKVSELAWLGADELLVLERVSHSCRIYRVRLRAEKALPADHLDPTHRPTVEELSADDDLAGLPTLDKQLVFGTDQAPELPADLEGMAILSPSELLLVNDNDFGVEGAETQFWTIAFDRHVLS